MMIYMALKRNRFVAAVIFAVLAAASTAGRSMQSALAQSARMRNWNNGDYDLGDRRAAFVDGRHAEVGPGGTCSVCITIREVTFGDVDGDGVDDAILLIDTNLGGAGTSLDAYVFGLRDGRPVLKAHLEGGDRGEGGIQSVSVTAREVIVQRFEMAGNDGVCCPSRVLVERWRWTDGRLVKAPGAASVRRRKPRPWYVRP